MRQALAAGGAPGASDLAAVEVEQLSDVANAIGNLYRCRLISEAALIPMVIGCGALDLSDPKLMSQARAMLGRVLTAIEELDSWEFLPPRRRFPGRGSGFAMLSRFGYRAYRLALRMHQRRSRHG